MTKSLCPEQDNDGQHICEAEGLQYAFNLLFLRRQRQALKEVGRLLTRYEALEQLYPSFRLLKLHLKDEFTVEVSIRT